MSNSSHQTAHAVLEYLITKAVSDGESQNSKLRLSYEDVAKSLGKETSEEAKQNYGEVDLVLEFSLYWDEAQLEESDRLQLNDEVETYED